METKTITKREFISLLSSGSGAELIWGGSSQKIDFIRIVEEKYEEVLKMSRGNFKQIVKSNDHKITWSDGSILDLDQWGTKKYYRVGRIIMQLTTHENERGYENFKTAVIYLLAEKREKVA